MAADHFSPSTSSPHSFASFARSLPPDLTTDAIPDMSLLGDFDDLLEGLNANDFDDVEEFDEFDGSEDRSGIVPEEARIEEYDPFLSPLAPDIPPTVGFSTGRFRSIAPPSAAALARVRKLFNDEGDSSASAPAAEGALPTAVGIQNSPKRRKIEPASPARSKFTTGNGHAIAPPSPDAVAAVTNFFTSASSEGPRPESVTQSAGFTIGAGAAIAGPSQAAMAYAANLFADEDGPGPAEEVPPLFQSSGFQTGSGRAVASHAGDKRAQVMALFGEPSEPSARSKAYAAFRSSSPAAVVSRQSSAVTPFRPPAMSCPGPGFKSSQVTPARTPLRTTTNTFTARSGGSGEYHVKLPKPVEIKTPASAVRRIGLGGTRSAKGKARQGFVTPFKAGGSSVVRSGMGPRAVESKEPATFEPVFDFTRPPYRTSLRQAYLHPQYTSVAELVEMGIPDEIWKIDLSTAQYYQFIDQNAASLGVTEALAMLKRSKCHLATAKWVQTHWEMILWKLAGEVQAKPGLFDGKWTWAEVISQLKYRYEREYGSAQRPIVRKIQEHDSSPSLPLVLCVSEVVIPPPALNDEGKTEHPRPYLQLTDGWYRIYAEVDECLVRAIKKRKIVVGRKLAVNGAKLESGGEGADVFEALDKSRMVISGNSCHLARWDARLGPQGLPFISGLSSLSIDGGVIALMDVVVEKVFPLAYMSGDRAVRDPPWNEDEERMRDDEWKVDSGEVSADRQEKYHTELTRLREEMRRRVEKVEDLANLIASSVEEWDESTHNPSPDNIDSVFEELLEAKDVNTRLGRFPPSQLVHLAQHARAQMDREMVDAQGEVEVEMRTICPPRDVRNFRMVRIVDAREGRKDRVRVGMLNVWDAKAMGDTLKEGARYLISNITPARSGDWSLRKSGDGPGRAEVYLHTRRDSRWSAVDWLSGVSQSG